MPSRKQQREDLQDRIHQINKELAVLKTKQPPDEATQSLRTKLATELRVQKHRLELVNSRILENDAYRLGLEIERKPEWWRDDAEEQFASGVPANMIEELTTRWLSPVGQLMVAARINEKRQEQFDRRFKMFIAFITALIPLVGTLIGLVSVLSRCQ